MPAASTSASWPPIFGACSDKREIQAALKAPSTTDMSGQEELWFDFLADTGDGFNPTHTTARLLAQEKLELQTTAPFTRRSRAGC